MNPMPAPVHFLLVDDLEENLLALHALLRRDGLVLHKARSGPEALELLLLHDMALAIVDVQMPVMDGFELAELMRGMERTRRVPLIFLTAGNADRKRRFRGYEAGAVDFLHKPIEPDILRSKADVFFELYRQRQEVSQQRDELKAADEEKIRLLEESRRHADALKEADRRKDEFLAMLAHELRNPLAPVSNAVEILRLSGAKDPEAVDMACEILSRQVSHMARLIDDLLDVARIARGKVQLRTGHCDLAAVVRQTAEDYRPTFVSSSVNFEVDVPEQPFHLIGDPTRLAQVIGNLLHNAGKFTPAGGTVRVRAQIDDADGSAVVTVCDSGVGLDAKVLSRLFEPFSQADQTLDRGKGGLGLGLTLVKGLIELHGGTVAAESDGPGHGSKFTLRLPLLKNGNPETIAATNSNVVPTNGKLRVLIVEDNRDAAQSLQMLLSLLGHQVEVAFDGRSGLAAAQGRRPDVVISDLGLPGDLDGYALARELRADATLADLYLIALSGYGRDDDRRQARAAGFDRHLAKPVDAACLDAALADIPQRELRASS